MMFPPWFESVQVKYVNPMIKPLARFLPGLATIRHRGRTSGKPYETVVSTFRRGNMLAIALGHGKTDWVKNVMAAGEADVHFPRRDVHLVNPRILPAGTGGPELPFMARVQAGRMAIFVADIA
jgi:deazaflavin-dependent oxidoreductase (nitroreductase family)